MIFPYVTDFDVWRKSGWRGLLKSVPLTWERAGAIEMLSRIRIVSAASALREPVHGPNWIAAGDAALAFDLPFGLRVHKAIESGLRSSAAITRFLEGDEEAMMEYENCTVESSVRTFRFAVSFMAASRGGRDHVFGNDAERAMLPVAGFQLAVTASLNALRLADGGLVSESPVIHQLNLFRLTATNLLWRLWPLTSVLTVWAGRSWELASEQKCANPDLTPAATSLPALPDHALPPEWP